MNSDRFSELLSLYLEDRATPDEHQELMQLIHTGRHDDSLRDRIHTMLAGRGEMGEIDLRTAQKMLNEIMSKDRENTIPINRTSTSWRWVAAAAVLTVSVAIGWWTSRIEQKPVEEVASAESVEIPRVVFSGKQFVRLPDGSTVILNAGSELSYTHAFGERLREVTLSGEGYFDVQHDPLRPFKVLTGEITTTVLGTAFNVKAYPGQGEIEVTVTRGKVQVEDSQHAFGTITPNQQIAVNTVTHDFERSTVSVGAEASWQDQHLILDDVNMEEAAKIIGEKYTLNVTLVNDALKTCRISATFLNGENLDQVLTVVTGVLHTSYTILPDGSVAIDGGGCE